MTEEVGRLFGKLPIVWQAGLILLSALGAGFTSGVIVHAWRNPVSAETLRTVEVRAEQAQAVGNANSARINAMESRIDNMVNLLNDVALDTCVLRERMPEDRNAIPAACRNRTDIRDLNQ